jgi:hypothetical protein
MPSINFTGAHIRFIDVRKSAASTHTVVHVTVNYSRAVCKAMSWSEDRDGDKSVNLEGELSGKNFILTPPGELSRPRHELQLDITSASGFKYASVKNPDGESKRSELRFQVLSAQPGAGALAESYLSKIGDAKGTLKISYEKQGELGLTAEQETHVESTQGELEDMVAEVGRKRGRPRKDAEAVQ